MATTTSNLGLTLPAVSDAADIGVLNTNFQKLDEKCNPALFAPSGYGLGVDVTTLSTTAELNALKGNGFFLYYGEALSDNSGMSEGGISQGSVLSIKTRSRQYQYFFFHYPNTGCVLKRNSYLNVSGWEPWEWVNPPMSLGVEYRTTERWNGNAVYTMLFDCGEAAVSTKQVTIPGVPAAANIFRYSGSMNDKLPLPHYYSYPDVVLELHFNQSSAANEKYCIVHGNTNYTASNVKVQIWYTKP